MDLARMIVDVANESQQRDGIVMRLFVNHRYEYEITCVPCNDAVNVVFRTLCLRATTVDTLKAILDFLTHEIADDVANNLRRDIRFHAHPPDREQGISVDVMKNDTIVFQNYFRNGNVGAVVQRYLLPMWHARY